MVYVILHIFLIELFDMRFDYFNAVRLDLILNFTVNVVSNLFLLLLPLSILLLFLLLHLCSFADNIIISVIRSVIFNVACIHLPWLFLLLVVFYLQIEFVNEFFSFDNIVLDLIVFLFDILMQLCVVSEVLLQLLDVSLQLPLSFFVFRHLLVLLLLVGAAHTLF